MSAARERDPGFPQLESEGDQSCADWVLWLFLTAALVVVSVALVLVLLKPDPPVLFGVGSFMGAFAGVLNAVAKMLKIGGRH